MSVIPVTFYQAKCDVCGDLYEDDEGCGATSDRDYAIEAATNAGWLHNGNHLTCPGCLRCTRCGDYPAWVGGESLENHNQILCDSCERGPAPITAQLDGIDAHDQQEAHPS